MKLKQTKTTIIASILSFIVFPLSKAQEIMLEKTVNDSVMVDSKGPNSTNYNTIFTGFNFFVAQPEEGSEIKYILSNEYFVGWRYKRKLSNVFSIGNDLYYSRILYNFEVPDDRSIYLSDDIIADKVILVAYNVGVAPYLRINFDPNRGNIAGFYLDASFYFDWAFDTKHQLREDFDEDENAGRDADILKVKRPEYINRYHYGIIGRLGYNKIALVYKQRLNDFLNQDDYNFADLPEITVGFELSF